MSLSVMAAARRDDPGGIIGRPSARFKHLGYWPRKRRKYTEGMAVSVHGDRPVGDPSAMRRQAARIIALSPLLPRDFSQKISFSPRKHTEDTEM
jgi:hypothetical protein